MTPETVHDALRQHLQEKISISEILADLRETASFVIAPPPLSKPDLEPAKPEIVSTRSAVP